MKPKLKSKQNTKIIKSKLDISIACLPACLHAFQASWHPPGAFSIPARTYSVKVESNCVALWHCWQRCSQAVRQSCRQSATFATFTFAGRSQISRCCAANNCLCMYVCVNIIYLFFPSLHLSISLSLFICIVLYCCICISCCCWRLSCCS